MKCKRCGRQREHVDQRFCHGCGAELEVLVEKKHKPQYVYLLNRGTYDDETPGVWEARNAGFVAKITLVSTNPRRFDWEITGPGFSERGTPHSDQLQFAVDAAHEALGEHFKNLNELREFCINVAESPRWYR